MISAAELFIQAAQSQLDGNESPDEVEGVVRAAGEQSDLPSELLDEIARQLRQGPRLFVDWGHEPHVGSRAVPEFHLICPPRYAGRPKVRLEIDPLLDHRDEAEYPELNEEEPRYWTFRVPFRLMTDGCDCLPGTYNLSLFVTFPDAKGAASRHFSSSIRLTVHPADRSQGPTLEIQGDEQSLMNLHGDIRHFGRVVLKGSGGAVINVQDFPGLNRPGMEDEASEPHQPALKHEYKLKVDRDRKKRIMVSYERPAVPQQKLSLMIRDEPVDRNVCLLAQRRTKLGKRRSNDIVVRVLPPSPDNDKQTVQISREHARLLFDADGLVWQNQACQNGTIIDGNQVAADASQRLGRFSSIRIADVVQLNCELFDDATTGDDSYDEFERDIGKRLGDAPLGTMRAARFSRTDTLSTLEEYIVIQRAITIGSSPICPIRITHRSISPVHAQILFLAGTLWLEPCQQKRPTLVDGQVLPLHRLAPLRPNLLLQMGDIELLVTQYQQYYVDTMPA